MLHKFREAPARASFLYSLHTSFARGLPMAVKCLATVSVAALMCEAPVQAQGIVRAEFSRGAIAEYTNNPNGPDRGILFSTLNITGFTITQSSANGQWGGTQGNDTAVTATVTFSDGTSTSFPAAINWVKNAGSGSFDWVGLTIASGAVVKDGYTPTAGYLKTYVLQFPKSTLNLSSLLPNGLDGSANTGAALSALNQNFPNATPPVITGPSGGTGSSSSAVSVNENQSAVTTLSADKAVIWAITGGADAARFSIGANGAITFNAAPDFEIPVDADANNVYLVTVRATDGNGNTASQSIAVTVLDLDDTAPLLANQSFAYAENQTAGARVGTVAASDAVGVTGFRFSATGTQTSADGFFAIDASGAITLTPQGAAAGAATNDFEIAPNSFTYQVAARDAAGNWSKPADVTLAVTDIADKAPVITGPDGSTGDQSTVSVSEGTTIVATLTTDISVSSWAIIGGNDKGRFEIDAEGRITFVLPPDFEAPSDADGNNTYILTVEAIGANGGRVTQTLTVTVTDLADTPPVITGPDGSTGAVSATSVPEGTSTVAALSADVAIARWAIVGGNDKGLFAIDAGGQITFVAAPDFEAPTDSDGDNVYVLTVEAVDEAGNRVTQTVSVTVTDVADTPPVILGSDGMTKAPDRISVDEGTLVVTRLTGNVPISAWSITGGNDKGRFAIDASGVISFTVAPDFDEPVDSDGDNIYVLVIEGVDADGNRTQQTLTVTVNALPDTAPVITGPSGEPGATSATVTIEEALTLVTRLSADVAVEWAIVDGDDRDQFAIDENAAISFRTAPDFEAPTDRDRNNAYLIVVQAQADDGSTAFQSITITVTNVDEIGRKIEAISPALRSGLRNHAFASLATMVSFNENLLGLDEGCTDTGRRKPVSGGVDANEERQEAGLQYARELSACNSRTRFYVDGGAGLTRVDGNWTTRALASARVERRVGDRATLGIAALGTAGSDSLPGFERADVKDRSIQVNAYGRTMLSSSLRAAAFAGYGRAWYSFDLENDGLELTGEATGKRYLVGAALSGDVRLAGTTITTDAVYTKAVEELGSARLDASAGGESRADIGFALGQVDISRLSVPVHVPLVFDHPLDGRNATRLDVSPGLVCQDTSADTSSSDCGYQLGLRFQIAPTLRSSLRAEARLEAIDGFMQNQFTVSYERRILPDKPLSIGLDLGGTTGSRTDGRIMARLGIKP